MDGRVILGTPIFDQGTDTYTTLRQVVAEELQIEPAHIEIEVWDTDAIPFDSGVAGSRATRINTIPGHWQEPVYAGGAGGRECSGGCHWGENSQLADYLGEGLPSASGERRDEFPKEAMRRS